MIATLAAEFFVADPSPIECVVEMPSNPAKDWIVVLGGPIVALLAIFVVGLAGRRRDSAVQLIDAHSELTSTRVNGARGRLFQVANPKQTGGRSLAEIYGKDPNPADQAKSDAELRTLQIDDYFTLLYAIEAVATAVDTACMKRCGGVQRYVQYLRGVLPKKRAEYLGWHVDAIMGTVSKWRAKFNDAHKGKPVEDSDAYDTFREQCEKLREYGLPKRESTSQLDGDTREYIGRWLTASTVRSAFDLERADGSCISGIVPVELRGVSSALLGCHVRIEVVESTARLMGIPCKRRTMRRLTSIVGLSENPDRSDEAS